MRPLLARTRQLRRNQTDVERRLWYALRDRRLSGAKFRRQVAIGGYIVDFVCHARHLIIELDGGQHTESMAYDEERSRVLARHGYRVLRFWNNDVIANSDGVLTAILLALES
jgi:adenine-specific DNA-methyltransferase